MKKYLALLLCLVLMLTSCGKTNEGGKDSGGEDYTMPADTMTLLTDAAERTAAYPTRTFTAKIYGVDYHYSGGAKYYTFSYDATGTLMTTPQISAVAGTHTYARSIETETRTAPFYAEKKPDAATTTLGKHVISMCQLPLVVSQKDFLERHLPDDAEIRTEGELAYVEFTVHIGDLAEALTGKLPTKADCGNLAQIRIYVNTNGQIVRCELDHPGLPENKGATYTSWVAFDSFSKDTAVPQKPAGDETKAEAEFPTGTDKEIKASGLKKPDTKLTLADIMKYDGRLCLGYYSTVGLLDNGTVICCGERDTSHEEVKNWTDIKYVYAGTYGIYGIRTDGTLLRSGKDGKVTATWDLSGFTDLVSVYEGSKTLYGLKSDGTVVATGEKAHLVNGWKNVVQLSANGDTDIVLGLKSDGTVLAAGRASTLEASKWTDIVQVAAGRMHAVGLKSDGTVVALGDFVLGKDQGELNVQGWQDIVYVAADNATTVGIRSDGTVMAAGRNATGKMDAWRDLRYVEVDAVGVVGLRADGLVYLSGGSNNSGGAKVEGWDLMD